MIKKHIKKDISPEERQEITDKQRLNNSIIMEYQKTAEETGRLIGNKIANRIMGI